MGKRITQQARGKGSLTFRVRKKAYIYKVGYPKKEVIGKGVIERLIKSPAHSAPLAVIRINNEKFYIPAAKGVYEGKEVEFGGNKGIGNVLKLKDIPLGSEVYNIELSPGDGGKITRTSGSSAVVTKKQDGKIGVLMKNKKEIMFNEDCRACMGVIAGHGRMDKPMIKAGNKHYAMKSKGRKWHRTSAIKTNAVDHPFGSGRGKRIKSKIAKRNAPPGAKVGHIRPSRTGRKK